ncbi:MAG: hypothetical protein DRJ42_22400 [Deltaproteobacteria bacterium]|nr:MAG: hypothetical protein DRJ42_22400 [Deltaproteobacteria bacterium]
MVCFCVASAALGCGRLNFGPRDASSPVDAARDTSVDAGPQVDVGCAPLAPVSPAAPADGLIEPGLRTDGLSLFARFSFRDLVATRGTVDDPFSDWAEDMTIRSIAEDPHFIDFEGSEIAAGARRMGEVPRHLTLCRPPFDAGDCDQLSIFDEDGVLMTDDLDGPALAIRDGELFMAFNRTSTIYIARPRASDLDEWDAALVDMGPGVFGDPTLTNDGAILITDGPGDALYVAEWDAPSGTYVHAHPVIGVDGGSADIGVEVVGGFELFVTYDSRGLNEPHRTTCTF